MERRKIAVSIYPDSCTLCRNCQLICSFTHRGVFNPFLANLTVDDAGDASSIVFLDTCKGCGVCVDYCVYGALEKESTSNE